MSSFNEHENKRARPLEGLGYRALLFAMIQLHKSALQSFSRGNNRFQLNQVSSIDDDDFQWCNNLHEISLAIRWENGTERPQIALEKPKCRFFGGGNRTHFFTEPLQRTRRDVFLFFIPRNSFVFYLFSLRHNWNWDHNARACTARGSEITEITEIIRPD